MTTTPPSGSMQMPPKTPARRAIDAWVSESYPDEEIILFGDADGDAYDEGFIGVGYQQHRGPVAVYDRDRCLEALIREFTATGSEEPEQDAVEWFSFNTEGSWIGDQTPIIVNTYAPL